MKSDLDLEKALKKIYGVDGKGQDDGIFEGYDVDSTSMDEMEADMRKLPEKELYNQK